MTSSELHPLSATVHGHLPVVRERQLQEKARIAAQLKRDKALDQSRQQALKAADLAAQQLSEQAVKADKDAQRATAARMHRLAREKILKLKLGQQTAEAQRRERDNQLWRDGMANLANARNERLTSRRELWQREQRQRARVDERARQARLLVIERKLEEAKQASDEHTASTEERLAEKRHAIREAFQQRRSQNSSRAGSALAGDSTALPTVNGVGESRQPDTAEKPTAALQVRAPRPPASRPPRDVQDAAAESAPLLTSAADRLMHGLSATPRGSGSQTARGPQRSARSHRLQRVRLSASSLSGSFGFTETLVASSKSHCATSFRGI